MQSSSAVISTGQLQDHALAPARSADTGFLRRALATVERRFAPASLLDRKLTSDGRPNQKSRFAFSMIRDRGMHCLVRLALGPVRESVPRCGGEILFKFAQTKGAMLEQIMLHRDTSRGVCAALSAHWIAAHAQQDSLFNHLYVDGVKGRFQIDTLVSIKQLQMDGMAPDQDQDKLMQGWLEQHGISPRRTCQGYVYGAVRGDTGSKGAVDLAAAIVDTAGKERVYQLIGIAGKLTGHAMAVCIDHRQGVTFFDPNFGEFHFPNPEIFSHWLVTDFWRASRYNMALGVGEMFEVASYYPK